MIIVTNVSYPPEGAKEVAKRFLEAPETPSYMTRRGPYVSSTLEEGIVVLTLHEVERAKLADAVEFLGNYMAIFFGVPDFRYNIRLYNEVAEALKTIGMG